MILQLSSGQGPAECELAVGKLFAALQAEFPDIEKLSEHPSEKRTAIAQSCFILRRIYPILRERFSGSVPVLSAQIISVKTGSWMSVSFRRQKHSASIRISALNASTAAEKAVRM